MNTARKSQGLIFWPFVLLGLAVEVSTATRADPEAGRFADAMVDGVEITCSAGGPEASGAALLALPPWR
jgi:hypothetical protein